MKAESLSNPHHGKQRQGADRIEKLYGNLMFQSNLSVLTPHAKYF